MTAAHAWDDVAGLWLNRSSQVLWRRHSDAVNTALALEWLPKRCGRLLKTDLFDEAVSGGVLGGLASRSDDLVGIDLSPAIVEAASRHGRIHALAADVRRLPFDDGSFGAVLSNSTLDHFDSPREILTALAEIHRVLRPGGTLLLTLDNAWNPVVALSKAIPRLWLNASWSRHATQLGKLGLLPYHVGVTLDAHRLREALGGLGFDVDAMTTVMHAPRPLAVVVGSLLERHARKPTQERYLRALMGFEALGRLPSRYITGYFVAVRATRAL